MNEGRKTVHLALSELWDYKKYPHGQALKLHYQKRAHKFLKTSSLKQTSRAKSLLSKYVYCAKVHSVLGGI